MTEYYLPAGNSKGGCYHATECGAHILEPVPEDEAIDRIMAESLDPCGNCIEHHDLKPI